MVILVAGLPGSGKSYFAERLARQMDALYLNSDRVRLEVHANGLYSDDDKLLIYRRMATEASRAIELGQHVIVDATFFHHTLREPFVRLAQACSVPLRIIEVTADESLIRQRLSRPRTWSEADYGVYERLRDLSEEIVMPHLILVSTDTNIESMLHDAIQYIAQ